MSRRRNWIVDQPNITEFFKSDGYYDYRLSYMIYGIVEDESGSWSAMIFIRFSDPIRAATVQKLFGEDSSVSACICNKLCLLNTYRDAIIKHPRLIGDYMERGVYKEFKCKNNKCKCKERNIITTPPTPVVYVPATINDAFPMVNSHEVPISGSDLVTQYLARLNNKV